MNVSYKYSRLEIIYTSTHTIKITIIILTTRISQIQKQAQTILISSNKNHCYSVLLLYICTLATETGPVTKSVTYSLYCCIHLILHICMCVCVLFVSVSPFFPLQCNQIYVCDGVYTTCKAFYVLYCICCLYV